MQTFNLGDVLSKLLHSNVSPPVAMGVWGQSPQQLGWFLEKILEKKFLEKKAILISLDHISRVFTAISKN